MAPRRPAGECGSITVLKNQPESEKAHLLLLKIHSHVKPIMKKHGWYLPMLAEFFPKNPSLLGINVNAGQKICIRLRLADDPYSFLPLDYGTHSLIGIMLHELTHNKRGPHDDTFFKILDGLQDEYEALRASGYSGEGFFGKGNRVGEGVGHDTNVSLKEARGKALRRIEERNRVRKVLGQGGRLGGKPAETKGKRMGAVLAEAAERRLRANKACGGDNSHGHPSGSKKEDLPPEIQVEIDQAKKDGQRIVIDLTGADSDDDEIEVVPALSSSRSGRIKPVPDEAPVASTSATVTAPSKRIRRPSSSSDIEILPTKRTASSSASSSSRPEASSSRSTSFEPARKPPSRPPSASTSTSTSTASPAVSQSAFSSSSSCPLARTLTPQAAWTCPICTFGNTSPLSLSCEVCLSERPPGTLVTGVNVDPALPAGRKEKVVKDGWACEACTTRNEHTFWTCKVCGRMKRSSERG
ncbi:hypothetical protein JCM8547_001445 [Rhodosporidiobolus lusitaniae]